MKRSTLRFLGLSFAVLVVIAPSCKPVERLNMQRKTFYNNDYALNYDTTSTKTADLNKISRADWPITMIWIKGGHVPTVKDRLSFWLDFNETADTKQNVYLLDSPNKPEFDEDGGKKHTQSFDGYCMVGMKQTFQHTRLYADTKSGPASGKDRMNNATWGDYVVASTHRDKEEGCGSGQFGWSEDVEREIRNDLFCVGYTVSGRFSMNNAQPDMWKPGSTKSRWQSDGVATLVDMGKALSPKC